MLTTLAVREAAHGKTLSRLRPGEPPEDMKMRDWDGPGIGKCTAEEACDD